MKLLIIKAVGDKCLSKLWEIEVYFILQLLAAKKVHLFSFFAFKNTTFVKRYVIIGGIMFRCHPFTEIAPLSDLRIYKYVSRNFHLQTGL